MGNLPNNCNSPEEAVRFILRQTSAQGVEFRIYRTVLKTPTWHKELFEMLKKSALRDRLEIVDPYSLMVLLKRNCQ
jgi:hypothetical protein